MPLTELVVRQEAPSETTFCVLEDSSKGASEIFQVTEFHLEAASDVGIHSA